MGSQNVITITKAFSIRKMKNQNGQSRGGSLFENRYNSGNGGRLLLWAAGVPVGEPFCYKGTD